MEDKEIEEILADLKKEETSDVEEVVEETEGVDSEAERKEGDSSKYGILMEDEYTETTKLPKKETGTLKKDR